MNREAQQTAVTKRNLHETGPGTLMGRLLRQFWQPIGLVADVPVATARPVRILGEDLTLFRGQSGAAHLVASRCAHRRSLLHTGMVDGETINCMYHGWRYDGTGLCTLMPAEPRPRPTPVRITAYPVHEYCGLLFAYMGQQPAPAFDLPRKDELEASGRQVLAKSELWDCNWFQQVENSMDAVHLNFAHVWGTAGRFGASITAGGSLPKLEYEETESGIRQIATRTNDNVRISDWTFPNNNHIVVPGPGKGSPWAHVSVWAVPVDDTHTMRFRLYSTEGLEPAGIEKIRRDLQFQPMDHAERLFAGDLSGLSEQAIISAQDYVAVKGQGAICDREMENLSPSDAGVVLLRNVFLRELAALDAGRKPKQWTRLAAKVHLPPPPPSRVA